MLFQPIWWVCYQACWFLSILLCAWTHLICKWRQKELSVLSDSDWLSYICMVPAVSWCAFYLQGLWYACFCWPFMKHKLVKCPNLWQLLHWYLFAGHWKPSKWVESPHLLHLLLLVSTFWVKGLLVVAWLFLFPILVLHWPWLGLGLLLLVFSIGQFSVLVSHQVDLGSLHFTCHLLDMSSSGLWAFIFLDKLVHLASWELVQVYTNFIYCVANKVLIM